MCTHAHAHACTRTHARTHTHTHARTHGDGGGGGHGGGSGSGGYGGRGGGSASQIITWHRATISQRGFPHVAQATFSIRGFPRVLFTGLLRPPAMPEDDGGRPSPPDIGEATCMCVSCMLRAPAHGTSPTSGGNRRTHQSWTTMKKSGTRTRNRSRNRATQLFEFPPRCLEWPPFLLSICTRPEVELPLQACN